MSGAGAPLVDLDQYILGDPGAVSRVGRKGGPVLETAFVGPFKAPDPTDRPWVSEDGISTIIKTCRKIWSGKLILAAMRWKSKQKNKTKNIYLNKLPNISVWKQTFFRSLKKTLLHRRRGCKFKCIIVPSIQKPLSIRFSISFFLRLPSFHQCP